MGPPQTDRALILRTRAYGESDRIVTFLTQERGKLTGIAKGARNSRRRFANCLDPFTLVNVHYRSRASAGLVFMDSCDLLTVPGVLADPVKFAYGSYLIEVVDLLTVEAQPVDEIFNLLEDALAAMRTGPATPSLLRSFELRLLAAAGFAPQFHECSECRAPLVADAWFDRASGSLRCASCNEGRDGLVSVSAAALTVLATLEHLTPTAAQSVRLPEAARNECATLLGHWLALHLPRPLKSVSLIQSLSS